MGSHDISMLSMALAFLPLTISFVVLSALGLKRHGFLAWGVGRMAVQLWLLGLYLSYIFAWNHPLVTLAYLFLMLIVANISVLHGCGLRLVMFSYTFVALTLGIGLVLVYYIFLVFRPTPIYDARYIIPTAGMLLGNSINRTIVTLERFYGAIRQDREGHAAIVTMGATIHESIKPYLKKAYRAGFEPMLANIATMGLVFIPGMMTGQILGGASPGLAIKYQIAIVLAIAVASEISTLLAVRFSLRRGFDGYGFLRADIFNESKSI